MTLDDTCRNAACDAVVDLFDNGFIDFQTAAHVNLAQCNFGATAFGAAAAGIATANAIADDTDAAAGTVDHAHMTVSGPTERITLTVTAPAGGGDIELSSLALGAGDTVSVTSLTVSCPAS